MNFPHKLITEKVDYYLWKEKISAVNKELPPRTWAPIKAIWDKDNQSIIYEYGWLEDSEDYVGDTFIEWLEGVEYYDGDTLIINPNHFGGIQICD
jgi:hypothetical protein